jgi:glyoxylase-like metal-dependent hydrolase (beta-lactamase superfamily II)
LLFAGDHVLPHITPSIGFEQVRAASPLADYLISLSLVRAMPDAVLLPAHGPAMGSVHQRVDELLAHHEQRLDATLAALQAGANTALDVADRIGWTRRHRRLATLDPFNQMLAILETAAHLDLLVERGRAERAESDGTTEYLLPGG